MHLYGGEMDAWNAVDVQVDGQLQHGRVINMVDGGLIVDFGCHAQHSQFVEYGRIFRWSPSFGNSGEGTFWMAVSVLLRRPTDGAWIWHIGMTVHGYKYRKKHSTVKNTWKPEKSEPRDFCAGGSASKSNAAMRHLSWERHR
ncbi:uncharacterized protein LOC129599064 isoform X2 [Paramacrobiotus metropolitanus]|uniref:uncharacterized protein LOC129599064 isoform X2 n=1 Tax=Paramacrobiotus metropolitanus TaxID=2943436 RepID=UPI002445BB10|nr:uncharacterized protein LOC129599064 isoform X2 [Paramacrobiotus metropolitanus]